MTTFIHYGKVAHFTPENVLILDGETIGEFKGLKEAKEFCESLKLSEELKPELFIEPVSLSESQIALVLKEDSEIRPTESVVSSFKTIVETKSFFPVNALVVLREKARNLEIPGKIDYILDDGSKVALDVETNLKLNTLIDIKESAELIKFMRMNKKNFLYVVEQIIEEE